ncbi:MAG: tRNA ((37)-N6)-threonylcarbamoyltransferase complex transferase subunit TsaD [Candidatus Parcubacteria bacterium]|jgi:N6-L-threonylcarbamoyladenine synthase
MRILAIESSCDESAAAYLSVSRGRVLRFESVVATQAIHAKYGGVVPEVAAREHAVTLPLVLEELARKVGAADGAAFGRMVDVVAVTRGPGLVTSLKVGADTARALALAWKKKLVGVNHIDGHIAAAWLPGAPLEAGLANSDRGVFPALVLVVSGGHTEILLMRGHGRFTLLGATRDDAAGEAFDKTAKLMGLGYPGGPALSKLAQEGDPSAYAFPRPMLADPHFDFSFSGLKTAVRYFLDKHAAQLADDGRFRADVAASTEKAIVDVLIGKTVRAAARHKVKTVMIAGGVAANRKLRSGLAAAVAEKLPGTRFAEPPQAYCTDNAAMIAMAGYFMARTRRFDTPADMDVDSGWELGRVGRGRGPIKKKR